MKTKFTTKKAAVFALVLAVATASFTGCTQPSGKTENNKSSFSQNAQKNENKTDKKTDNKTDKKTDNKTDGETNLKSENKTDNQKGNTEVTKTKK